jgi:hypothetical protein
VWWSSISGKHTNDVRNKYAARYERMKSACKIEKTSMLESIKE